VIQKYKSKLDWVQVENARDRIHGFQNLVTFNDLTLSHTLLWLRVDRQCGRF